MEFEPTIPEFERVKTVLALDRAAIVIGTEVNIPVASLNKLQSSQLSFCISK
jgi:hypothetical protein